MPYKYLPVAGTATYVHHSGPTTLPEQPPDLGRGAAIVCVHDAGANQGHFDAVLEALAQRHGPVAFDLPGHGRSGGLDSLASVSAMAKFSGELLGALGARRPVVLGHGLGGAVALQLALDPPLPLRALVLASCGDRFGLPEESLAATRQVVEGRARRGFAREHYGPEASREVLQRGFVEGLKTDPRATLGDLIAWRAWEGVDAPERLQLPVLLVHGEHELAPVASAAQALAGRLPQARLVRVPGAGHELPLEQPAALAEAVEAFLAELPE